VSSVEDLARTIRDAANSGLRVAQGTVVAVVDTTHVSVDLGDRVITAYRPGSVPAGAGAGVRVLVGSGVAEVVSSTGGGASGAALPFSMAAGAVTLSFKGAPASASVTFPTGRFTQAPVVTATLGVASLGISLSATSVTAAGCTIGGSSSYTGSVPVRWVAVQMTSASGTG
jgi:hypothetical protein